MTTIPRCAACGHPAESHDIDTGHCADLVPDPKHKLNPYRAKRCPCPRYTPPKEAA